MVSIEKMFGLLKSRALLAGIPGLVLFLILPVHLYGAESSPVVDLNSSQLLVNDTQVRGDDKNRLELDHNAKAAPFPEDQVLLEGPEFLPVDEAYQLTGSWHGTDLYLDWTIAPGYYLYRHQFKVRTLPDKDQESSPVSWQQSFQPGQEIYDDYYEKNLEVYYGQTRVVLTPTGPGQEDRLQQSTLEIHSQGCADAGLCYPPRTQYLRVNRELGMVKEVDARDVKISMGSKPSAQPLQWASSGGVQIWVLLSFALLGGLLLNLMPCVFPVLSIKVLGVAAAHLEGRGKHLHGLAYTAGVILSFVVIAVVLLVLRGAGQAIGWGFQLQSPALVMALVYLFFLMGLGFSGQFSLGAKWMNLGQKSTQSDGFSASFMTGVLATVVASPCTAPFMGTALGVAITQPGATAILIFAMLGLGMALPFLLLTWIPGMAEKLPGPGPWMETFRQLLAFPLYATVLWLLWVLGRQTNLNQASLAALGLLLLALAIWWFGRQPRLPGKIMAGLLFTSGLVFPYTTLNESTANHGVQQSALWQPYTAARLERLRAEGRPVFVNLTADWCITCLANEKVALSSEGFESALRTLNIQYLKGDWTNHNPEITRLLNEHGRGGVPLYLFYPGGEAKVRILPQLLTENIVLGELGYPQSDSL